MFDFSKIIYYYNRIPSLQITLENNFGVFIGILIPFLFGFAFGCWYCGPR